MITAAALATVVAQMLKDWQAATPAQRATASAAATSAADAAEQAIQEAQS